MSTFREEKLRLEREVAARSEWIDEILRLEPEKQKRLYEWIDSETQPGPEIAEAAETIRLPVADGELRVLHTAPVRRGRPILFVPGWGALPEEFAEFYEFLHGEAELYYLETREKRSSTLHRGAEMSVEQSARDIAHAIDSLGLRERDFLLLGSCWGASIIVQGLYDRILSAPTVLLVDPMESLWFPRWLLRFFFRFTPDGIVRFLKPLIVRLKLRGMTEPRQRARAEQFIRAADVGKWRRAAVAARNFQLAGRLETIEKELFVLNCSADAIHDQRYYPVLTDRLPRGRFLSLQVDERHRERMIGLAAREFAKVSADEGVPESLRG
ncbi:MAG: alpha/beta fold hydrolase, partial [Alkalispirochaetaceae bacterium]